MALAATFQPLFTRPSVWQLPLAGALAPPPPPPPPPHLYLPVNSGGQVQTSGLLQVPPFWQGWLHTAEGFKGSMIQPSTPTTLNSPCLLHQVRARAFYTRHTLLPQGNYVANLSSQKHTNSNKNKDNKQTKQLTTPKLWDIVKGNLVPFRLVFGLFWVPGVIFGPSRVVWALHCDF